MGRQDDLNRMRRARYEEPHDGQEPDSLPSSNAVRPAQEPLYQAGVQSNLQFRDALRSGFSRSRLLRPRFKNWMVLLVSCALAVILLNRIPSMSWFPLSSDGFRNPDVRLTSTSGLDQSSPQIGDRVWEDLIVTQGWHSNHMGIDVALPAGQDSTGVPLYAIGLTGADVEVRCWYEPFTGLNVSTHSEGMDVAFDYGHLNACRMPVGESTTVKAGEQIAEIGNTGSNTTGPHLHFQQRDGATASPITGTHVPGWRSYLELSLSGKTISQSGTIEGDPASVSQRPKPDLVPAPLPQQWEAPPDAPRIESPSPSLSPVPPSNDTWRSPTVYPPI